MDIINLGFGVNGKIINEDQFKKLKLKPNENTIFKILFSEDNDGNEIFLNSNDYFLDE